MPPKDSSFFERVYEIVHQIPEGKVTSYGAIAKYLGTGRSARVVGWAMNFSHTVKPPVPAHRVVNRIGMLSGKNHFATSTLMEEMLEQEGVLIEEDQIQNFNDHFWDPAIELER